MKAVIDIGTNSVILLIVNDSLETIHEETRTTRFGSGEGSEKTFNVISEFIKKCKSLKIENIKLIGTASLRSKAGKEFANKIKSELGFEVQILLPEEEAKLALVSAEKAFGKPIISIDIGGGSTDIGILLKNDKMEFQTFEGLGAVALLKKFPLSDPPKESEIVFLEEYTNNELFELNNVIPVKTGIYMSSNELDPRWSLSSNALVGGEDDNKKIFKTSSSGGTVTTLAQIDLKLSKYESEKIHGHKISLNRLKEILDEFVSKTQSEREKIIGLTKDRSDIIIPGTIILISILEIFHSNEVIVNHKGIRWGILYSNKKINK